MTDKITYYAIVNELSSRERPAGVFRRIYFEVGGKRDEAFTTDLEWERSASLVSAERGDLLNEFIEITQDEANQIVARIRAELGAEAPVVATGGLASIFGAELSFVSEVNPRLTLEGLRIVWEKNRR